MFSNGINNSHSLTVTSRVASDSWRPGQQLQATVNGPGRNGTVSLNINGMQVEAHTDTPVKQGQTLSLEVVQTGRQPVLRVLGQAPSSPENQLTANLRILQQGTAQQTLSMGERLTLQTLVRTGQDIVNLTIKGESATAQLQGRLPAQGPYTFEVVKSGQETILRLLSQSASASPMAGQGTVKTPVLQIVGGQGALPASAATTQSFTAQVIRSLGDTLTLQVQQQTLTVRSNLNIPAGTLLELQTVAGKIDQLALLNQLSPKEVLNQTLRQVLPQQLPLPQVLQQLGQQLGQLSPGQNNSPDALTSALRQLVNNLPQMQQLTTGTGLHQALSNTGLFLENKLAQAVATGKAVDIGQDLKASLLQILNSRVTNAKTETTPAAATMERESAGLSKAVTDQASGNKASVTANRNTQAANAQVLNVVREIQQQAGAGLARIQLSQSKSVATEETPRPALAIELPVRQGDQVGIFNLLINRDQVDDENEGRSREFVPWSVTLSFELEILGAMRAYILLIGKQVSVTLWAEQEETAALFNHHAPTLKENLEQAGLQVSTIQAHQGLPEQLQHSAWQGRDSLLDLKV